MWYVYEIYLSLRTPRTKLSPHHKCSANKHSTCCSDMSRTKQATCSSTHLSVSGNRRRSRRKNSPFQTWLELFFACYSSTEKSQTKNWTWQSSAFVLFFPLCLTSLIQNMRRALLSRLPRAAIWPAAPEAAGYQAQSNGGETLHCCEPSNGNLRAPEAAWEQTVRHIRFASVTEHQRLSLTARH